MNNKNSLVLKNKKPINIKNNSFILIYKFNCLLLLLLYIDYFRYNSNNITTLNFCIVAHIYMNYYSLLSLNL